MKIKNLTSVPFEEVINCFLTAFQDYFVALPDDLDYWRNRFINARVDWELSYGMFDGEKLVAYVIHGIDQHENKLTAYNTGTGVLPDYRGKAVVDQIYDHALPHLRNKGIEKCLLEVICENERAIKVYERIGFRIKRKLRTFTGELEKPSEEGLQKCHFQEVLDQGLYNAAHYSWDHSAEAVLMSGEKLQTYHLINEYASKAYLVIDLDGSIIQLEGKAGDFRRLLSAAGILAKNLKLKNVDAGRKDLIRALDELDFSNPVSQYEMEMLL